MGQEYILEASGICKAFPGVIALSDVDLRVRKGTVHALMGENGAGKSTMMKILLGIYSRDSGKIIFNGKEVHYKGPREALDDGLAMIHQELSTVQELKVYENIFLGTEICLKGTWIKNDKAMHDVYKRQIYASACRHFGVIPKTDTAKRLVEQAISQLQTTSSALAALKQEMQSLAASLPEYPVVMGMFGVGPTLGPQLLAEIGDVRRFHSKKALVAFAGIDAPPYQSGQIDVRSRSISKRGSASLRRTLFLVMSVILQCAPIDEPVYQFMDKKRSEGKPYRVYMMASANKFLRIYYASVKAYLESLEHD